MTSVTTCAYCQGTSSRHTWTCPTLRPRDTVDFGPRDLSASDPLAAPATTATDGITAIATTEAPLTCQICYVYPCVCPTSRRAALKKAKSSEALLDERQTTHGSFKLNAYYGQMLRDIWRSAPGWKGADERTREALDHIAGKLSRILSGKPNEKQHWEDIAGYACLVYSDDQR